MADVKSGANLLFLREEELRQAIELLYYAYRDFTAEPDAMLAKYGFGRAHHRVIYFVGRHPQMSVTDLLGILRITKQSLSRVLGQLVRQGFIRQQPGSRDQRQRIAKAYREAGAQAVEGFRKVMLGIIGNDADRRRFERGPPPR